MYTGTLIHDLLGTVERVEQKLEQQRMADELHAIFTMEIAVPAGETTLMGAA